MPTHVHSIEQSQEVFRSRVPGANYYYNPQRVETTQVNASNTDHVGKANTAIAIVADSIAEEREKQSVITLVLFVL
jgi:hypothetical protein